MNGSINVEIGTAVDLGEYWKPNAEEAEEVSVSISIEDGEILSMTFGKYGILEVPIDRIRQLLKKN